MKMAFYVALPVYLNTYISYFYLPALGSAKPDRINSC